MKSFEIMGRTLEYDDNQCVDRDYTLEFKRIADDNTEKFMDAYENAGNMDNCMRNIESYYLNAIETPINLILKKLQDKNIFDVTKEFFIEKYCSDALNAWYEEYSKLEEQYSSIVLDKEQMEEYRRERKANRGRWVGGGFGVKGAIKGAVTAGAMNAVGGVAHGMVNVVGNAVDSLDASRKKTKLYEDEEKIERIAEAVYASIMLLKKAYYNVLRDYNLGDFGYPEKDQEYSDRVLDNIWSQTEAEEYYYSDILPDDKKIGAVIDTMQRYPYNNMAYIWLFICCGDRKGEIRNIADYFGIDLSVVESKLKESADEEYNPDNRDAMNKVEERFMFIGQKYGISVRKRLRDITKDKEAYSLRMRTVHDLITDYEIGQDAKAKIKESTVEIVKDTEEEAAEYRKGIEKITDLYNGTNFDSKEDVDKLYQNILFISENLSLGQDIIEELKTRLRTFDVKDKLEQVNSGIDADSVGLDETNELTNKIIVKQESIEINKTIDRNAKKSFFKKIEGFRAEQGKPYRSVEAKAILEKYEIEIVEGIAALKTGKESRNAEIKSIGIGIIVCIVSVILIPIFNIPAVVVAVLSLLYIMGSFSGLKTLKENNLLYEKIKHHIDWNKGIIKPEYLISSSENRECEQANVKKKDGIDTPVVTDTIVNEVMQSTIEPENDWNNQDNTVMQTTMKPQVDVDAQTSNERQTKHCVYCGKEIAKDAKFCSFCGKATE